MPPTKKRREQEQTGEEAMALEEEAAWLERRSPLKRINNKRGMPRSTMPGGENLGSRSKTELEEEPSVILGSTRSNG